MGSTFVNLVTSLLPQLFVGGTAATLISVLVNRRGEQRKLAAEASKADAEKDSEFVDTARALVAGLREELEVQRLRIVELEERVRLADKQVGVFTRQTTRLAAQLTSARAELASARAELELALGNRGAGS